MTSKQLRYFSRKTQQHHVTKLCNEVWHHPNRVELMSLITDQVADDTNKVIPQVVYI